jgi:hypothetical protein
VPNLKGAFDCPIKPGEYREDKNTHRCRILLSASTTIRDQSESVDYSEAGLLILHAGGMEQPGRPYTDDHLCFKGVVSISDAVGHDPESSPKLNPNSRHIQFY